MENIGIRYLDAYIDLHLAILCVEHLIQTESGEALSQLRNLQDNLGNHRDAIKNLLEQYQEGTTRNQQTSVNQDRSLPSHLLDDPPQSILFRGSGAYLMEAIGILEGILGDISEDISNNSNHELNERLQQLLQRMETTLENLRRIRLSQGEREGGKRKTRRRKHRRSRHHARRNSTK